MIMSHILFNVCYVIYAAADDSDIIGDFVIRRLRLSFFHNVIGADMRCDYSDSCDISFIMAALYSLKSLSSGRICSTKLILPKRDDK